MPLPGPARSLSARLLILTIAFVMLAEVLIYTPSIARFRNVWLNEKLAAGHLAALATVAAPEGMVTPQLEAELLAHVGAYRIYLSHPGEPLYSLGMLPPAPVSNVIDMDEQTPVSMIASAFETMMQGEGRMSRMRGFSPRDPEAEVEVIFDETALHDAMWDFSWRILGLSIIISLITASLVFLALRWLTVRPLMRFTEKMVAFRNDPDDAESVIVPSRRTDEVGVAERELHHMQTAVLAALKQKDRLAALGTAVTKINHDLRNMLGTASLVSERLAASGDPEVQRTVPRLMEALDRAADLCSRTLDYTREGGPALQRSRFPLADLARQVEGDLSGAMPAGAQWRLDVPEGLQVHADREQLRRVLVNLARNAFQAGAETVTITAGLADDSVAVTVRDDGPGLPPRARQHLFQPFAGSARPQGTGLGLAIAREIVTAHRGEIRLLETGPDGTAFRISLPR
ncbi:MAG: sensor histidine kinase [Alphaproteobacteria bacterium]|jgi:signal transduction histidine kinase|nr:sensor histidine kinase [Alphaproteobacteria bacterium]